MWPPPPEAPLLAQQVLDAWNRRDLDGLLAVCHADIEWTSAIKGEVEGGEAVYRGHDGMRRFWEEWQSLWDLRIEIREIREAGERVVILGGMRTSATSGVELESPVGYVFEFEDGRVRRLRSYLAHDAALAAAGLS